MPETNTNTPAETDTDKSVQQNPNMLNRAAMAMIPFTPVGFSGEDAPYAWLRLATYGVASLGLYKRNKTLSYTFGIAAGVGLLTSLSADGWKK